MDEDDGIQLEQPQSANSAMQRVGLLIILLATLATCVVAVIVR